MFLSVHDLPAVNASLNALSGILLSIGYVLIRARRIQQHKTCMIAAFSTSSLFLVCYLVYHAQVGSVPFPRHGFVRPIYFTILTTHTILAIVIVPLIIITFYRALRQDFARHRRIARITLPLWLYVSITGVIVYLMLYQIYPS